MATASSMCPSRGRLIWNCLPYHEKALLIRNEYIFAFNQLETMSQDFEEEECGGVVVSG